MFIIGHNKNFWLKYYSELRQYKEGLETRFKTIFLHQTVGAAGTITLLVSLKKDGGTSAACLIIGMIAAFGLGIYSWLSLKYFRQARIVAGIMSRLEISNLEIPRDIAIKQLLCNDKKLSIFTHGSIDTCCRIYGILLVVAVVVSTYLIYKQSSSPTSKAEANQIQNGNQAIKPQPK